MIINTQQIHKTQLEQLDELVLICKNKDGSAPNIYTHILTQARTFPAASLYYEDNKLVGFLSVFFFYSDAVEISILVHPEFRKKQIATELLAIALPLVASQNYHQLIFSVPTTVSSKLFTENGYTYLHSEYYMEREELSPILFTKEQLSYRLAITDDIPQLSVLDELCFPGKNLDLTERFNFLLHSRDYQILLCFHQHQLIGKAHLRWQAQGATLSDIAIKPSHQGRGLGTELISHCINLALSEGKSSLNLDVETHNKRALNLYTGLGFVVHNACDYWTIPSEKLVTLMSIKI